MRFAHLAMTIVKKIRAIGITGDATPTSRGSKSRRGSSPCTMVVDGIFRLSEKRDALRSDYLSKGLSQQGEEHGTHGENHQAAPVDIGQLVQGE